MLSRPSWNPVECAVLSAALVSGIAGIVEPAYASQVVQRELPGYVVCTWYIAILIGSVVTLYGLYIRRSYFATVAGYGIISPVTLAFSVTIIGFGEAPLAYTPMLALFISIGGFMRGLQLFKFRREVEKEVE